MAIRDPEDFDRMLMEKLQQHEGEVPRLIDSFFSFLARKTDFFTGESSNSALEVTADKLLKYVKEAREVDKKRKKRQYPEEQEHSNTKPSTSKIGDSKIQELTDDEAEKLQRELAMEGKGGLEANSDSGGHSANYPWTLTLPQTGKWEFTSLNKVDGTAFIFEAKKNDSLDKQNPKNPLLLIPVIRRVHKFLNIKDLKSFRLVCRDWGSIGKPALASLALIRFEKDYTQKEPKRFPVNFQSCFLDSTSNFSAFEISGIFNGLSVYSWTLEELENFFEEQQKYLKELTLKFTYPDKTFVDKIDLSSWISKSPLVKKDAKYLTKLSVGGKQNLLDIRPLHLIAHIKDLSLVDCKIHVETGIKISPIKLELANTAFIQDGMKLDRIRINDIVDFSKPKEVTLHRWDSTKYVLDLSGSATLGKLTLIGYGIEILNWETSEWVIEHLATTGIPYSLNSEMKIKELHLSRAGFPDLLSLPTSIQNLVLYSVSKMMTLRCSQAIVLQNLQYLQIVLTFFDYSFLSHFKDCPQLTHLKLHGCMKMELKSSWIPKSVKTLTLEGCFTGIKLLDENHWNLETLVFKIASHSQDVDFRRAKELCETKLRVDDFVVYFCDMADVWFKGLVDFLDHRQHLGFCKRLFVGELKWKDKQFEETGFKEHVETKSSFYVFQDGQKGCAVSETAFYELIPKHLESHKWL